MAGMLRAYIFRYRVAPSISSSLVCSMVSIGPASSMQIRHTMMPKAVHSTKDVWTVFSTRSRSPMPRPRATATLTPLPMPISSPVNSDTSSVVDPTAPRAR